MSAPQTAPYGPARTDLALWDATKLSAFRRCPRLFWYEHVQGWRAKRKSVHLTWGGAFGRATEARHVAVHAGQDGVMAATQAADALGRALTPDEDHPEKSAATLLRSAAWYAMEYEQEPFVTATLPDRRPAVEVAFALDWGPSRDGVPLQLAGRLDRVVRERGDGALWVMETKTTKSALSAFWWRGWTGPQPQVSLYALVGGRLAASGALPAAPQGVIMDAVQVGVGFTRFGRRPAPRARALLAEWEQEARGDADRALALADVPPDAPWPANDTACSLYGGCAFAKVCSQPPALRAGWLSANFEQQEAWNPLRGPQEEAA